MPRWLLACEDVRQSRDSSAGLLCRRPGRVFPSAASAVGLGQSWVWLLRRSREINSGQSCWGYSASLFSGFPPKSSGTTKPNQHVESGRCGGFLRPSLCLGLCKAAGRTQQGNDPERSIVQNSCGQGCPLRSVWLNMGGASTSLF